MERPDNVNTLTDRLIYQPRFDCGSGALTGARLHAVASSGPAAVVLSAADGLDTLHEACTQAAEWSRRLGRPLTLTLSARLELLCDPVFAQGLNGLLLDSGLAAHGLQFDIVTSDGDIADAIDGLQHLKRCGIRLALDVSSPANAHLAWVGRLPLDCLEVPAALAQDVVNAPEGIAIARALVLRAHRLKLGVCVAGVDEAGTATAMTAAGCDEIEGPLVGAALPAEAFDALVVADRRIDATLLRGERPARTLLLVDDEANILSALRRLLRREGYAILTASSGEDGLAQLAANAVDVIVSDQRMQGMTGVEFLRKAKDMAPDSVRMVLSGYTDLQSVTDAINEGAIYKFLTKPWDDAMLIANIEEAFRRKLLTDENRRLSGELKAANAELERINAQLKNLLADRERRLGMEETALSLTHEALTVVPVPLLGVDPGGMIALANAAAETLFAGQQALIGVDIEEILPEQLAPLLSTGQGCLDVKCGDHRFRVEAHPLGEGPLHHGTLLSFIRRSDTP